MRSDILIKKEGFKALFNKLDIVEAERFIVLLRREKFDYTELRKDLFEGLTIKELSSQAMKHWNKKNKTVKKKIHKD